MRPALRAALALAVACLPATAADLPPGITARSNAAGTTYADAADRTLYTYAQDKPGKSACVGACAKAWPPLTAPPDATIANDWTPIAREDGSRQWAFRGQPLYTYAKDDPGTSFGDGLGNLAWRAAFVPIFTPPGIAVRTTILGQVLVDGRGRTLYWRSDGKSCDGRCLDAWMPLRAPLAALGKGDWSPVARADGTRQWAFRGRALYGYAGDLKAGDVAGHRLDSVWDAAVLAPAPPLPPWVTIQASDMGEVFADSAGHTLYAAPADLARTKSLLCDDACLAKVWRPVPAAADAKPTGDWSIVADSGGARLWAYRGNPIYTHTRDTEPGAIGGDKWAAGVGGGGGGWTPITRPRGTEDAP
jgi:predicted lipoprotein with Yx(FWY)xxD motif